MALGVTEIRTADALLRERVDHLLSLSRLSETVARPAAVEEIYAAALDCLAATLSPDRASILLFGGDGVMRFEAWRGLSDAYREATEGRTPWSPETKEPVPVLVADAVSEAALDELRPAIEAEGIRSLAFFPLVAGDRLLGKLMVCFDSPHTFTAAEVNLAQAIGSHLALEIGRRRAEEELRRNAALVAQSEPTDAASVLAHVGEGVFRLDLDRRVTLWNRGAEVITGISAAEALGQAIHDLFLGWEAIGPRVAITDVPLASGRREALPAHIKGRELWLAISGVASREGVVYAFRDVTEAEKLEKARQNFLATASHELRTPLAGVFGATKTLLNRSLDERTTRQLLAVIDAESERLAAILDEILLASRLDAGGIAMAIESCDVAALAAEAIEVERTRTPAGVTLSLASEADAPIASCDTAKLRQVLRNLLDNAIKYSPEGGAIVVALASGEGVLRLSVTDHGIGIPSGEHERIFERFYRLGPEHSRGVGGTGLGLYICRELVTRMDGRIWVESAEGAGSTFHLELPAAP